jgi:inosose dehydratase
MSTRRQFLQWAGIGATAALAARRGSAQETPAAGSTPSAQSPVLSPAKNRHLYDVAIASYTFRKFPLAKMLAMVRRIGVKHLCLKCFHLPMDSSPENIRETVAKIKAAGIHLYGCGPIDMKTAEQVAQGFEYTKIAGGKVLVCAPSVAMLPMINDKAKQYDLRIAIHNHGPDEKVFTTPDAVMELIKDLDRRMGLCMDIGHTVRFGADPIAAAERYADRLYDIHMKDVSAASKQGKTVEAGRGIIDIPRFLRTLDKTGYAGYLGFEFEPNEKDPLPGVAEAVGYVRGVMAVI